MFDSLSVCSKQSLVHHWRLFWITRMPAMRGMSKNMSRPNANAPGELNPKLSLQAHQQACIAVTKDSSTTWLPSAIDFGSLATTTMHSTCPMVWWICAIKEFPWGFLEVEVECLIPLGLHMAVNSLPNLGPWLDTIFEGQGFRANHASSTAADASFGVVVVVDLISTRLVHGSIIVIAWNVKDLAQRSIFQGPIESHGLLARASLMHPGSGCSADTTTSFVFVKNYAVLDLVFDYFVNVFVMKMSFNCLTEMLHA